jgi:hypothetical protein
LIGKSVTATAKNFLLPKLVWKKRNERMINILKCLGKDKEEQ